MEYPIHMYVLHVQYMYMYMYIVHPTILYSYNTNVCACALCLVSTPSNFEQLNTGLNRPIPGKDMRNIESQLRHHFHEERRRKEHRGDLLRADPYQNSIRGGSGGMADSTTTSADMFYSLNLHDSFSESSRSEVGDRSMESSLYAASASSTMGDSYSSTAHSRAKSPDSVYSRYNPFGEGNSPLESITLSGGTGLQQLAHSPGAKRKQKGRSRGGSGGKVGITQQDLCQYSLTLSGVTVAVLEANPAYTHPTDKPRKQRENAEPSSVGPTSQHSSLDSSGLDAMCYLSEVTKVLRGGVNRREIQRHQDSLAQALPQDHLL